MKKLFLSFFLMHILLQLAYGQTSGTITVGGDLTKFYPVTWHDEGWGYNSVTTLEIGRSNTHLNSDWRGSLSARFDFHVTHWGNGAPFINAQIAQYKWDRTPDPFVAGWQDVSGTNGNSRIVIWLKGGGTTYHFKSNYNVNPVVYDGSQNVLPFMESASVAHTFKSAVEWYVNSYGHTDNGTAFYNGAGTNAFLGNLGVGTTAPAHRLHVLSSSTSGFPLKLESPGSYTGLLFKATETAKQLGIHFATDGASGINTNNLRFGRYSSNLSWEANPILFDLDAPDASLVVSESGNVGLGVYNPLQKLEVAGFAQAHRFLIKDFGDNAIQSNEGNNLHHLIGTYVGWDPKAVYVAGYNASNNSSFATEKVFIGNMASDKYMAVNLMNGKVGIGTTNTTDGDYRLYVEKGIRTRKVKVDQAVWADYVFKPSYRLLPLSQVEAFISKHGHLPEVPSEKEVVANGIDIGETQTLLLKKIEELTLYIIDQNKRMEALEKKLKKGNR